MRRFGPQRGHRGSEQADVAFANVSHESPDNIITEKDASRVGVYSFALLMFAAGFAAVFVLSSPWLSVFTVLGSAAAGLLLASTLRVAAQWEHVALLRFGRFRKIAGPGVYVVVPFVDSVAMHIDRRTITTAFYAEQALTSDLVSVDVDAILFWMVYDSEKACLEVANFPQAVRRAAQTAVRDAIGQVTLAELSVRRRQLDHELQEFMAEKCEEWGISVISWRSATSRSRRSCRTRWRERLRPNASATPACCWQTSSAKSRRCTWRRRACTTRSRAPCSCVP